MLPALQRAAHRPRFALGVRGLAGKKERVHERSGEILASFSAARDHVAVSAARFPRMKKKLRGSDRGRARPRTRERGFTCTGTVE